MTELDQQLAENTAKMVGSEIEKHMFNTIEMETMVKKMSKLRKFYGKNIEEWEKYFEFVIDPTADPAMVNHYVAELNEKLNVAYGNQTKAKKELAVYKLSFDNVKSEKIMAQVNSRTRGKTTPAAESLDKIANSQLGDRATLVEQYETTIDIFQSYIYKLNRQVELVKTMGMSNGTLAKLELGM